MDITIAHNIVHSPLGYMRPITTKDGITRLDWQQTAFDTTQDNPVNTDGDMSKRAALEIAEYLQGKRQDFSLPIDYHGISASMRKWYEALCTIPYGALWSYGELAAAWGNPKAARPAGQACRRNPIPVIIPCHRVITRSGGLNQYSGGSETTPRDAGNLARKDWLQALEAPNADA